MMQSNLEYLSTHKPKNKDYARRLALLQEQIRQLQAYHKQAKPQKRHIVLRLIVLYTRAQELFTERLERSIA